MKNKLLILVALFTVQFSFGQNKKADLALIPEPVSMVRQSGEFSLPKTVVITTSTNQPEVLQVANMLQKKLTTATGYTITKKQAANNSANAIHLSLNKPSDKTLGDEGYILNVTTNGITISANQPAGLFYGVQSLYQLLPPEIESKTVVANQKWTVPAVKVTDYPRFKWRGLMFDVSRHFFTKEEVKEFIDQMVLYKFNLLHMHLTDDEGWRIEIKGLPKLTEVGAWRATKTGYFGTFPAPAADEPRNYGGFYTQEDIKELVKYAADRFVDILPEIDVPGHSLAAIVAYPELSCTPGADKYQVRSGEEIMDWSQGAPPIALVDNTLCPANEKVYTFLDTVITQLAKLFPFEYIHLGGDETPKNYWAKTPEIAALMKKEGLKNYEEVQSYFGKRVEKIVESKGKKFMGWDEILEGGLAPSAAVMSWRGMKGGIEAAKMGHNVVMSPTTFAYLDYMQTDPIIEPRIYATLRLSKAYQFEPLPEGIDPKYILGGQANLWTEQVYNMRHLQYMVWPRAFAIAESVWSPASKKNWDNFVGRVEQQFKRFDEAQIKYAPSMYDPLIVAKKDKDGNILVDFDSEVNGLDLYYTFDNSFPDNFYPRYTKSIPVPKEAFQLRVISYRDGKPIGRMLTIPVTELQKRASSKR